MVGGSQDAWEEARAGERKLVLAPRSMPALEAAVARHGSAHARTHFWLAVRW